MIFVKNKEELKSELIENEMYIFPTIDSKQLSKDEWSFVLELIENDDEYYICWAIETRIRKDSSFITENFGNNGVVTNWHFDQTRIFLEDYFGDMSRKFYRVLWIEYILEHYDD